MRRALLLAALFALAPSAATAQRIDVVEMTVDDVAAGYRSGAFTAVELTQAFLDRIARYEGRYNAFVSLNPDALRIAAELDAEYARSGPRGPLHGVPVVIKDNIDYEGMVTTCRFDNSSMDYQSRCAAPGESMNAAQDKWKKGQLIK